MVDLVYYMGGNGERSPYSTSNALTSIQIHESMHPMIVPKEVHRNSSQNPLPLNNIIALLVGLHVLPKLNPAVILIY